MGVQVMDFRETLADFKTRIDREIGLFFDTMIEEARKKDVFTAEGLKYVKRFILAGGKRLRGTLFYYGYLAGGGEQREEVLRAAVSVELVHIFLLIHDDIMDRDMLRHGIPTVHEHYAQIGRKFFPDLDAEHFGRSMALIMGDMIGALGNQALFSAPFPSERVIQALIELQSVISLTVIGQSQDLLIEHARKATEAEVLRMYENKTARYTIESPLRLGYILSGGADEIIQHTLSAYALPVGIAFQIQDDILDIFGSEQKIGKPVASDLVEGKITLMVSRAFKAGSREDKKQLQFLLKRGTNVTMKDVEEFRSLIRKTGAFEYAQMVVSDRIQEGLNVLAACPSLVPETREFLSGVAKYMQKREY